jgi:hypothetical protein
MMKFTVCIVGMLLTLQLLSATSTGDLDQQQQQYLELKITNKGTDPIRVRGNLRWGFWYLEGDRQKQITAPNQLIQPGQSSVFAVASRLNSPTSAEGQLDIFRVVERDSKKEQEIAKVDFDCAHSGQNRFRIRLNDDERVSTNQPDYKERGVMGRMHLKLFQH